MRIFILTLAATVISQYTQASTFVGNGGNAGDIELQMTLEQATKTFNFILRDRDNEEQNLCTCTTSFEGRPLCDTLNRLNKEQVKFCSRYLLLKAADLARVTSEKGKVSYTWTHQQIEVKEQGRLRGADAVTNPKEMSMTLNQTRFLQMDSNERLFLVGHELFHLTSHQGQTLSDEGEIGPFQGPNGGRQFINAMAATLVMQANQYGVFSSYSTAEKRSKAYKQNWLSVGYSKLETANDKSTAYDIPQTTGGHGEYRYQLNSEWGVFGSFSRLSGSKGLLTTGKIEEERNTFGVGLAYRWFPWENPMTFRGQSHFVLGSSLDLMKSRYELNDPAVGTKAETSSMGYTLSCKYFIPFSSGWWAYGGVNYSGLNHRFNLDNQVELEYKNNGTGFALGVSYGF